MGLFGFGKKQQKKSQPQEEQKSFVTLNARAYPRYVVEGLKSSLGEVADVSKDSLRIGAPQLKIADKPEIAIASFRSESEVVRCEGGKAGLKLAEKVPLELIEQHMRRVEHNSIEPKRELDIGEVGQCEDLEIKRAIVNLMLEIDDPNTDISKFKENIEAIEPLKEKILMMANSVEVAGRGYVKDVGSAISRLGFDAVKKIVYEYIVYDVTLSHEELKNFANFESFNLLFSAIFKKLAPLFNFKDYKNEGRSLLTMSSMGAVLLSQEVPEMARYYDSVSKLFSLQMRLMERRECGYDFFEINKQYFLDRLGVFRYLYDGFALAFFMLYPHYAPKNLSISLSQRKLRYAYVVYLAILAQKFLLDQDRNSGYIFFYRLKRLGYSLEEVKGFLVDLVNQINTKLALIGLEQRVKVPDFPAWNMSLERFLGSGVYTNYLLSKWEEFDQKGERLALRYEDEWYAHRVVELLLNHDSFHFLEGSFCVVPCEILEDDELPLAMFEGFDLILFKNVDRLAPALVKEFLKIWRDFEGKIVVTFSAESMLEYRRPELFEVLNKQMVDFPSYFQTAILHNKMVNNACADIERFFGAKRCNIEEFKSLSMGMESLYTKVMEGI